MQEIENANVLVNKNPLVSVIIPLYNAEKYIAETLQNVLEQTYSPIEILVVDDGSSDNSLAIARTFECKNVKIFTQPNCGASAARNLGLREAKGDFIQFLDADDLLSENKIEQQIKILLNYPNTISTSSIVHFFDGEIKNTSGTENDNYFLYDSDNPSEFLLNLYGGNGEGGFITVHSWLTPRQLIDRVGYWNEALTVDDDGEYFCRVVLAADGVRHDSIGKNYYRKFRKNRSLSSQNNEIAIKSALLALELKQKYLSHYQDNSKYRKAFARAYKRMAVDTYPRFSHISKFCIEKLDELGGSNHDVTLGGNVIEMIKKVFGWKVARKIQYCFRKINKSSFGF